MEVKQMNFQEAGTSIPKGPISGSKQCVPFYIKIAGEVMERNIGDGEWGKWYSIRLRSSLDNKAYENWFTCNRHTYQFSKEGRYLYYTGQLRRNEDKIGNWKLSIKLINVEENENNLKPLNEAIVNHDNYTKQDKEPQEPLNDIYALP